MIYLVKIIIIIITFIFILNINTLYAEQCDKNCLYRRMVLGIEHASQYYNINPQLLWIIAKIESNYNFNAINKNKNKTYDYGVFQINSSNLKKLGYPVHVAFDPYWSAYIAAYILKKCINEKGHTWAAIDCYNKGSDRAKNNSQYVWNFYKAWIKASTKNFQKNN